MRVQLTPQAKAILGQSDLVIITERVDDVALLIGQMVKMGLPEVLDRHIPRHWTQRGLSWGWTAVIWLASIVTEGDHRKVSVETYLKGMHHTLSHLTAHVIEPLDLSDDRLSHLLQHLSKPAYWHEIEHDLNECSIEMYDLSQDVIRCDATTVSSDHEVTEGGLVQFGHSKDDPTRPQIKVMMGSLDPLGMPLATAVLPGDRADDGLYIPIMERIRTGLKTPGLLFVGDCKMSALDTRAYLARHQDFYLSPLPLTGATAEAMNTWVIERKTQLFWRRMGHKQTSCRLYGMDWTRILFYQRLARGLCFFMKNSGSCRAPQCCARIHNSQVTLSGSIVPGPRWLALARPKNWHTPNNE